MSMNISECIKSKLKRKCKIKTNRKIEINNQISTETLNVNSTPPSTNHNSSNSNSNSSNNTDIHSPFKNNWISTTKYTILTFIPKNLFEQFCRVANLYFLFILVLCHTPISPVAPGPSAINLGIVLLINAIKEAYEDFHRYKSDKKINHQLAKVVTKEGFIEKCWKDLIVGDIVYIENEQQFPADMVLLSTSSELSAGHCYIETSNLDGETNLKCKQSLLETNHLTIDNIPTLDSTIIECESPTLNLNKFDGRITINKTTYPLTIDQLLIRGTTLMNTKHLYGVVIYTGHETKYMLNTMATPSKRSKLERTMNKILIYVLIVEALLCLGSAMAGFAFEKTVGINSFYLALKQHHYGVRTVSRFFTFVVLYSTIVPISLYVTMEIVRVFQIVSINKDKKMYHSETNTFANARTSNLNEELGQVEYIFSDKTGTLTRNEMEFRMCCINGQVFGSLPCEKNFLVGPGSVLNISQENIEGCSAKDNYTKPLNVDFTVAENLEFFIVLAICNTVIPEMDNNDGCGQIKYSSSSPDEIALVNASLNLGIKLVSRTPNSICVCVNGGQEERVYTILNILEFSSDRKRMSIIVKDPTTNEIIVYCKGADTSILPYLNNSSNDEKILKIQEDNLNKFSCNGLRTLCIAKKVITQQEYDAWSLLYKEASISISERDSKMEAVSTEMENNFTLLGVTGIEDKLQENVTGTISTLLDAGIKIWMLTGDKQETAINIGLSCQLLNDLEILIINDQSIQDLNVSIKNAIDKIKSESPATKQYGLVIDGKTLAYAFNSTNEQDFYDLTTMCKSVICCRVTPFQKSEVVRIVKDRTTSITLAIGDGANDVSMIQKAHIGIGISGKEGRQAVLASDFAISQFRFLERLVLVHGRYNYKRLCLLICYFFFKNLMSSLLQLWFSTNTLFSGQTFYDAVNILGYNLVFTSLPIIVMGVIEKDIDSVYLKRFPALYKECQLGKCFNHKVFWYWIGLGIYCSAVVYFFTCNVFVEGPTNSGGKVGGMWHTSASGFTALIFVVNLRLALVVNSWTPYHHLTIWGSLIVYGILETCYSLIYLNYTSYFHMVFLNVVGDPIFFISLLLTVIVSLLPAYSVSYIKRNYFPEPIDVAQEIQRYEKTMEKKKMYNV
ncbi:hypothetical protein CYY_001199 [Polysphondylium violaceum]|uniref:Phospholipid-transporting ATPase n=1 Tax=Polysphondylium violaceum TaxID=133409 RepID=A0A8J4Q2F0_9MYCE|nr:hypothetical protein CYY_001199 [Polysphondylium violaceum]